MGNSLITGMKAGGTGILSGIGMAIAGTILVNPALIGMGAAGVVAGSVEGATAAAGAQAAANGDAKTKRQAEAVAKASENRHKAFIQDAKNGAYGAQSQTALTAFSQFAAAGNTIKGAMSKAGLVPGLGTAQDKRVSRQLSKHYTGTTGGMDVRMSTGDPLHRATALARRSMASGPSQYLDQDRASAAHGIYIQHQDQQNAASSRQLNASVAGAGESLFGRVSGGSVQATARGTLSAQSG